MKYFILAALLATSQAIRLADSDKPAVARSFNSDSEPVPSKFAANNEDILKPDWIEKRDLENELVQTSTETFEQVFHWYEGRQGKPETNKCSNDNKATGNLEGCHKVGNSAWNTYSTAVTAHPKDALKAPYPAWPDWSKKSQIEKDYAY